MDEGRSDTGNQPKSGGILFDSAATELASDRTAMAFDRTRMSVDRTLMAMLRTSLALIGFGFTIFKFFHDLGKQIGIENAVAAPAKNFGITLVLLGVALLTAGLFNHWQMIKQLRARRDMLHAENLIRHHSHYQTSPTVVVAVLLLLAGLLAVLGIMARAGPFG
jgi:putative membrane protein